jgi:hypothetical protein
VRLGRPVKRESTEAGCGLLWPNRGRNSWPLGRGGCQWIADYVRLQFEAHKLYLRQNKICLQLYSLAVIPLVNLMEHILYFPLSP